MKTPRTEITMQELRDWLTSGRPVSLVDLRSAADAAEWSIPGSVNVEGGARLRDRDPSLFADLDLPADRPVVTICNQGISSKVAREMLAARGYHTLSLTGGMKSWSLAWNMAPVVVPGRDDVQVLQFRRTGKGCLSYLVGSAGRAVVIDPSLDPDIYLAEARTRGWSIMASLDTHVHADHLTRARLIEKATGAPVCLPETPRATYPYQAVRDSDALTVGQVTLTAMRTPGHTPESVCWRLDNRVLFTGDTLFVDAVGRPDLEATAKGAEQRAHALFRSLQHLFTLPGHLLVLPGHTDRPVPFDQSPVGATLDAVRQAVSGLPADEPGFVAAIMERIPPTPPNHHAIVKHNEKGEFPPGDPTDLEAGANRCAVK